MQAEHAACEGLSWGVVNIAAGRTELEEAFFDMAVDKGTLDYLLCGEVTLVISALHNVRVALAPSGILLVVSIHPLALWQALFAALRKDAPGLGFQELKTWSIENKSGRATSCLALRRPPAGDAHGAEDAVTHVLDQHFTTEAPLLTPRRRAALRQRWGDPETRRDPADVHALLFPSAAEQAEYPLELFLEDLSAGHGAEAQLSLAEAEEFLQQNQ
ncbi:unnamed protein product [Symbiodinium natans]|uniref:Methyltransferase type 11 domain-containing protein n=1 Tax=Symbiodinium natans TaxID=878477 RepID=A0A812PPZ6_9DINO|nr:unnamed protein product [Symbiodinium natans]